VPRAWLMAYDDGESNGDVWCDADAEAAGYTEVDPNVLQKLAEHKLVEYWADASEYDYRCWVLTSLGINAPECLEL